MVSTFVHWDAKGPTTLSELWRVHKWVKTTEFFGVYAYAVESGVAAFEREFGDAFWKQVASRWLFGIDYGRTRPGALRAVLDRPNTEVRVHDGAWTVDRAGFNPRRGFHLKTAFLSNGEKTRHGMVVGSGNLSASGLRWSVEAGATLKAKTLAGFDRSIKPAWEIAESAWEAATPAEAIIDLYESRWKTNLPGKDVDQATDPDFGGIEIFWIEAGYVTPNRGAKKPGNQIDMPKGMSRYFGFENAQNLTPPSVIGAITFDPPEGKPVTRNLRLGGNMMEKITLPIPETHGLDAYDGKVLVFASENGRFRISALEPDDFDAAFKHRVAHVRAMDSGRRYGHIV